MNLLRLFHRQKIQDPTEARRVHNYENALKEVHRWNQVQREIHAQGAELDQMIGQQIAELIQERGADSVIVQTVEEARQDYRHQNEISLQDAERRLVCYRNIILRQGRM